MAGILIRLGILLIVVDVIYLTLWEVYAEGADGALFRTVLKAGGLSLAGGLVVWMLGRAGTFVTARSCPVCRRRVARGRVYCDDHRSAMINRYRDHDRARGQ